MNEAAETEPGNQGQFQTTHWSLILAAQAGSESTSLRALESLCQTYWYPVYAFVRRKGHQPHDAQDLTQGFFARLLEKAGINAAERAKGKFRSFLLASLNNYLANEWDRKRAQKRGGDRQHLSIDEELAEERFHNEPATDETPEHFFDRQWALAVLERAMNQLGDEMRVSGKPEHFETLREFLAVRAGQSAYHELAAQFGVTPAALSMTVNRMRQRYRDLIRAEVSGTLADPADAGQEIRHLLAAMA